MQDGNGRCVGATGGCSYGFWRSAEVIWSLPQSRLTPCQLPRQREPWHALSPLHCGAVARRFLWEFREPLSPKSEISASSPTRGAFGVWKSGGAFGVWKSEGGATRPPPGAGGGRGASGSGRQDASLLCQAKRLPGTASGEKNRLFSPPVSFADSPLIRGGLFTKSAFRHLKTHG